MQLWFPTSLFWLLLAVPIFLLYLHKVRRRRISVGSILFWDQVLDEQRPRAMFQKLRHVASLFLQLLLLFIVTWALADPLFSWQERQSRSVVLVVDNSASMSATDLDPNRLARAKQAAVSEIRSLRDRDKMAIVSTVAPRVEIGLNGHLPSLRDALRGVVDTDAPARIEQSISLAQRLIEGQPRGEVIVLTDQPRDTASVESVATPLRWITFGTRAGNIAITQFQARRKLDDPLGFQVLVKVENFSDVETAAQLEITLEGDLLDVLPLNLRANEAWESVLDYASADGGTIQASLDRIDALPSDNRALAQLAARPLQQVILVTPGSLFLESVLRSIPRVELSVREELPAEIPADAILVVHRTPLRKVPAGKLFVIDPDSSSNYWSLQDASTPGISTQSLTTQAIVATYDESSPLLHHLQLRNVVLPGTRRIDIQVPHETLVESIEGIPLLAAIDQPSSRVLILSTELEAGDFPLRTAFPILMSNALNWFRDRHGELTPALSTGQIARITLTPDESANRGRQDSLRFEIVDSQGRRQSIAANGDDLVLGPFDQCGLWRLEATRQTGEAAGSMRRIACNLTNPAESDVRVPPSEKIATAHQAAWVTRPLWFYLVIGALSLTCFEWVAYQRRWIE